MLDICTGIVLSSICGAEFVFFLFKMINLSPKWRHFVLNLNLESKKVLFDDFLVTTSERENEGERKTEPQIPRPNHSSKSADSEQLLYLRKAVVKKIYY